MRINHNQFALITHQAEIGMCTAASFRRLQEGINRKEGKIQTGSIQIHCAVALVATDDSTGLPEPEAMMNHAEQLLPPAQETGLVIAEPWEQPGPGLGRLPSW